MQPLLHQPKDMTRRRFLHASAGALSGAYALLHGSPAWSGDEPNHGSLIVREKEPLNLEFPFHKLDSFITPTPLFYVRNHFHMPNIDASSWQLHVQGAVDKALTLTLDDLQKMPSRSVIATLECAGNSRGYLQPKASGVQWKLGAVSNAEWTGVPLGAVLDRAGLRDAAVEVVFEGTDRGTIAGEGKPVGSIHFARSVSVKKARQEEVLLAYKMNGTDLPATHGFPVRLIVPGWYGVASVKWLQRLVVTDRPFTGYFQSIDYSYFTTPYDTARVNPITELRVKAEIAQPKAGDKIGAGTNCVIRGAAWTGGSGIAKVEVSVDGGQSWSAARLVGKKERYAWRFWEYSWRTPGQAGKVQLLARATDGRGHVQPLQRDPNLRNYLINYVVPVEVSIE